MTSHTDGPWGIERERGRFYIVGRDGFTIAEVKTQPHLHATEVEANAALIANAPAMRDLIEKAHKDLCGCTSMGEDCGWPDARNILLTRPPKGV